MSHRVGTCSACGAQFKVPASFAAGRAKCKSCGGVVQIGPVVQAPPRPAPKPTPEPAASGPVEVTRPKKKREGPSMKEQLLAKRLAAEEAAPARAVPSEAPPAKPSRAPTARPAARSAPKPTTRPAAGTRRGAAAGAGSRTATRRRGRGEAEDASPDEGGHARRSGGSRHIRSLAHQRDKQSPLVPILAMVLVVIAAGSAWWFWSTSGDEGMDPEENVATGPEGAGAEEGATAPDDTAATGDEPISIEEGTRMIGDGGESGDAAGEGDGAAASAPEEAPSKPEKVADPSSVDLMAIDDFGPADDTDEAEWDELKQLTVTFLDPDAGISGSRARAKLLVAERKAFPALLNAMKRIDYSTEQGYRNGDVAQRLLMEICNGRNLDWHYSTTPEDELFNKKVVRDWCKIWRKAETDMDYWMEVTKRDKKKPEESGEEELGVSDDDLDALDDF